MKVAKWIMRAIVVLVVGVMLTAVIISAGLGRQARMTMKEEKKAQKIKKNDFSTIINMEGAIKSMVGNPIKKRGPNLASTQKIIEVL